MMRAISSTSLACTSVGRARNHALSAAMSANFWARLTAGPWRARMRPPLLLAEPVWYFAFALRLPPEAPLRGEGTTTTTTQAIVSEGQTRCTRRAGEASQPAAPLTVRSSTRRPERSSRVSQCRRRGWLQQENDGARVSTEGQSLRHLHIERALVLWSNPSQRAVCLSRSQMRAAQGKGTPRW